MSTEKYFKKKKPVIKRTLFYDSIQKKIGQKFIVEIDNTKDNYIIIK